MTNKEILLSVGCKEQGLIIIPPSKNIVPVYVRRLKNWSKERLDDYIKAIENYGK